MQNDGQRQIATCHLSNLGDLKYSYNVFRKIGDNPRNLEPIIVIFMMINK